MTAQPTRRWHGVTGVALLAGALGLLTTNPGVLLVAVVGVIYAVYPRLSVPPVVDLAIERTVSDRRPEPGAPVEVTVEVENTGDRTLPDVRLVDGVPPMLSVTEGSPRHATALPPGESVAFSYTVEAVLGSHRFHPITAIGRDLSGAHQVTEEFDIEDTIRCHQPVDAVPVRQPSRRHVTGPLPTDAGGDGITFQQTRGYRAGDPIHRIDWRRFAKTGDLSTVEFGGERTASIVLVVDTRQAAYRAAAEGEPHGVAYGITVAEQLLSSLLDAQHTVGVASFGRPSCWLRPDVGDGHRRRAMRLLTDHPAFSRYPPSGDRRRSQGSQQANELRRRLRSDQQLVIISPLADGAIVEATLALEAAGHAVMVVSPDVSSPRTLGSQLARVERAQRIRTLRRSNVPVVDWRPDGPLGQSLVDAEIGAVP